MSRQKIHRDSKRDYDLIIAKTLRRGVFAVGFLLICGWLISFNTHQDLFANYQNYQHESLGRQVRQALKDQNWGLLVSYLGVIALISLPLIRVLLTGLLFAKKKEGLMVLICLAVIFGLMLSFFIGAAQST